MRNMGEPVSRQVDLPCSYDGWETARKGFPIVIIQNNPPAVYTFLWPTSSAFT